MRISRSRFHSSLQLRYANNSNYKNDTLIRKEMYVSTAVVTELKRIVQDSEVGHPTYYFIGVNDCSACEYDNRYLALL